MSVPNVLATRYAGADLAAIWSPEHKIVLERQLWVAVLKAQRDLGVDVPDGVVEAYEAVIDRVDLESIAARERITRHDVESLHATGVRVIPWTANTPAEWTRLVEIGVDGIISDDPKALLEFRASLLKP